MLKISKVLLLLVLIAASFAGAMEKLWLSCVMDANQEHICYIHQGAEPKSLPDGGFVPRGPYTWKELIRAYDEASNKAMAMVSYVYLGTDVVFDGYDSKNKACVDKDFEPFPIKSSLRFFDGQGYSINNFCMVGDQYASFFKGNRSSVTIQNLEFDGAYVELNPQSNYGANFGVGVVADSLIGESGNECAIKNVTVKNSQLRLASHETISWSYNAGTLVGYSQNVVFENNVIENVVVSGDDQDGESIDQKFYVGGLVGYLNHTKNRLKTVNDNDVSVKIDLPYTSAMSVGGLIGYVELNESEEFKLLRNKIRPDSSVNSANADSTKLINLSASMNVRTRISGVVGELSVSSGSGILLAGNSVWGTIQTDASAFGIDGTVPDVTNASALGGIVGYINAENINGVYILSNSVIGGIMAPNVPGDSKVCYAGYVVGAIFTYSTGSGYSANIHFSNIDADVESAVRYMGTESSNDLGDPKANSFFARNFRNAVYDEMGHALLEEYGPISVDGQVHIFSEGKAEVDYFRNAVMRPEDMRQRSFTYLLNNSGVLANDENIFWENDSTNVGLPYITDKRTAYQIRLMANKGFRSCDEAETKCTNKLYDQVQTSLKSYFVAPWDTLNSFVAYTDRNSKIPDDFVKSINENFRIKYSLLWGDTPVMLDVDKAYGENLDYIIAPLRNVSVEYNIPSMGGTLVYYPKKQDYLDWSDPMNVIPVVYDIDNHKEYRATSSYFSCISFSGDAYLDSPVDLNGSSWNFYQVNSDESCLSDDKITLSYSEVGSINPEVTKDMELYVGAVETDLNVSLTSFGYDANESLVTIDNVDAAQLGSVEINFGSHLRLNFDDEGYNLKSREVDFWVYRSDAVYGDCKQNGEAKGCRHFEKAPRYLGSVDSIFAALASNDAAYWTITLDDTKQMDFDSLIIAMNLLSKFDSKSWSIKNYKLYAAPKIDAEVLNYQVTFMLPDGMKFYSERPFEKTSEFNVKNTDANRSFPREVYSNDYCVVGWTKTDYGTKPPLDWGEVLVEYAPSEFARVLDSGKVNLYPLLAPAVLCSEDVRAEEVDSLNGWAGMMSKNRYLRVMVDNVAGADINFKESRYVYLPSGDVGLDTSVVHTFGSSRQMLLSTAYAQEWFLSYNAKDGFEAPDSLLMTYQVSSEKPIWLTNGDIVYTDNLAGKMPLLSGEFKMVNTTALAFVDTLVETAGSTVRVKVSTTKFAAGRDAELLITFMDNLGNLIDTTRKLVHKTPYVLDTTYFVQPGSYVVLGLMSDALDSTASFAAIANVAADIPVAKDVWQMVSLNPVDMSAVGKDDDQIFYRWDDEAEVGEFWHYLRFLPGDDVESAGGYWYSSLEGRPLKFSDSYKDSVYDIEWNLVNGYSGWNMVGNPHNWNVKVPDDLEIVMWDPATGDYAPNRGYLKPFEAAWVRVEKNRKVSVNGDPYFVPDSLADAAAAKKRALVKTKNAENWTIRAILADNKGKMDSWNILGMGEAQEGYEPPSGMGDIVSFAVKDGKKYLAKSVKAAPVSSADSAALEWDVLLSASSDRKGKLYFEGLEGIAAYGYHLYVTVDGRTSELTAGDTLAVALKAASTTAKVCVTKEKLYFRTAVEGLRMVQAGNKLNVGFTATENLDGARMVVDILDMDGKVVSTYSARAASGSNAVSLDAPKSGLYMLRVRVASQQAAGKILVK